MKLPDGTVTFLFTDIVGSTKLWEQYPEAMRTCLARHDTLLRDAIESHEGVVFKTVGDAFCAVFASPLEALTAALAGQSALLEEPWEEGISLFVRMALHTGTAERRDNDYFGPPLNRVARLLAIGHGGQILLSEATRTLFAANLPEPMALQDLGQHQLKDLQQPERIFQLMHPALPADFPPLRSLNRNRHNLPVQTTSFIGRAREFADVKALLAGTRLLTLTGSGGTGKTRLSLQVAAEMIEEQTDGLWFVELAPLSDPNLVVQAVAQTLNVREVPGRTLLQTLTDELKSRQMLLLLDNCEHVVDAAARLADTLLKNCPNLKILASSRESLGIPGEQTYRVPSLPIPPVLPSLSPQSLAAISANESVRLFADRAALVKPDFAVTGNNAPVLCRVCHRLDGIPLALELAAARVRMLPVEQIEQRLDDRFRLLTGGSRTALPRQQTLRALVDWSYDLLDERERALLRTLSVFAGGWTLEAAEGVCAGEKFIEWEVLDLLTALVDKSLVLYEEQEGQGRFRLLETVRQYARERLGDTGEEASARDRHRDFFLQWAEATEPKLHGPEQSTALAHLECEHDNLRAALEWSLRAAETGEKGLRLAGALYWFWHLHSHFTEGRRWLKEMLTLPDAQGRTAARAKALQGAGQLAFYDCDEEAMAAYMDESVALWRELGDRKGLADALVYGGDSCFLRHDYVQALVLLRESLVLGREIGNKWQLAMALWMLGTVNHTLGNDGEALPLLEESFALFQEVGDAWGLCGPVLYLAEIKNACGEYAAARSLLYVGLSGAQNLGDKWRTSAIEDTLGETAYAEGKYQEASTFYEKSLARCCNLGMNARLTTKYLGLGHCKRLLGDFEEARRLYLESLQLSVNLKSPTRTARAIDSLARLTAKGQFRKAATLFGFAASVRHSNQIPLPGHERQDYEQCLESVRTRLSTEEFAAAWAEGEAMTQEQAVHLACKEAGDTHDAKVPFAGETDA